MSSYPPTYSDPYASHQYAAEYSTTSLGYSQSDAYQQQQQQQPPYASTDHLAHDRSGVPFTQADYVGLDDSSRRDVYPPNVGYGPKEDYGAFEKGANPVTRGSIAAQMAAEGQIPRKEGLRMWRTDEHAGALMRGGRGRCCMRVCGCSLILAIIIVVSIIAAFLLWTRPPDVTFNGIEAPTNGSEVTQQSNGFLINFNLNIGVTNPNFFGANFKSIDATAFYSTAPTVPLGGGTLKNVEIPKNSNTTIHFPFSINYTTTIDTNLAIVTDIAKKCGFISGGTVEDLTVKYTVKLGLKVVGAIVISPSFSSSVSFACPLSESDVQDFLGSSGLSGLLSSSTLKRTRERRDERSVHLAVERALSKVMERSWQVVELEKRRLLGPS